MFTITITEIPQATTHPLVVVSTDTNTHPLFNSEGDSRGQAIEAVAPPIEHARIQVATLDVHALVSLIYAKPKARRSDAGKPRTAK